VGVAVGGSTAHPQGTGVGTERLCEKFFDSGADFAICGGHQARHIDVRCPTVSVSSALFCFQHAMTIAWFFADVTPCMGWIRSMGGKLMGKDFFNHETHEIHEKGK
jgi:hypothetical protein